jgi:amidophosphoribosyltransferase
MLNGNLHNDRIFDEDQPHEECGVIGVYAPDQDVARMTFFGLYALQHRGQEAAGIAVSDGRGIQLHKDIGLVTQVFNPENLLSMTGSYAVGHTRYSTTGSSLARNAQPFSIDTIHGPVAVAHNGNLVNAAELRQELLRKGIGLSSSSDTEVLTMMLAGADGDTWDDRLRSTMAKWKGAYSLVVLTREGVYAVRDPWGFRPLSVGKLPNGGHAVASESGALETMGCLAIREVHPGEVIALHQEALLVLQALPPAARRAYCVFEHIYFSRPDSFWDGRLVHHVRQRLGEELAKESPVAADAVIPVPDSSIPAVIGYTRVSGIPSNDGFIKNRYIGRTFIQPSDSLRKQGVALKFNVLTENVRGKRLVVIDDSIVRGNTAGPLVQLLRDGGASEIHLRITCPPIRHPCYMGVDMGTYDELIAHRMDVEAMRAHIGCDSLHFLSLEGMMRAVGRADGYCQACFSGDYPIEINQPQNKTGFERSSVIRPKILKKERV